MIFFTSSFYLFRIPEIIFSAFYAKKSVHSI